MKNIFKTMFILMLFMAAQITAADTNAGKTASSSWSYYLVRAAGLLGVKAIYNASRDKRMAHNIKTHEELKKTMIAKGFLSPSSVTGVFSLTENVSQEIKDQYKGSLKRYAAAKNLQELQGYGWFHPGSDYITTWCVNKDGSDVVSGTKYHPDKVYRYPRLKAFLHW